MTASIGRITEKTSEPINVPLENWNLEEINMNKILEVKNCQRNYELIAFFRDKNFFDLFNDSSNGFAIIVIDAYDNFSIESMKQLFEANIKKAAMVMFKSNNAHRVTTLIKDSATGSMEILNPNRHQTLFRFLGDIHLDGNLFECEIDEEKFLEYFASTDYLTLRLLCCFEFSNRTEVYGRVVKQLVSDGALESFKIFVDNCFEDAKDGNDWKIIVDEHETDLMSFVAAFGKPELLEHLFDMGFDDLDRWVDSAWEHKNYSNVLLLLQRDAPFPRGFKLQQISSAHREEIKEIISARKKLHKAIEEDNLEIVQHFVDNYQTEIIGFNDENIPALCASLRRAMQTNSFEIYSYLLSKGFVARNSEFIKLERQLSEDQMKEITNQMKTFYGKHTSSHLCYLLSRSRFAIIETPSSSSS